MHGSFTVFPWLQEPVEAVSFCWRSGLAAQPCCTWSSTSPQTLLLCTCSILGQFPISWTHSSLSLSVVCEAAECLWLAVDTALTEWSLQPVLNAAGLLFTLFSGSAAPLLMFCHIFLLALNSSHLPRMNLCLPKKYIRLLRRVGKDS